MDVHVRRCPAPSLGEEMAILSPAQMKRAGTRQLVGGTASLVPLWAGI